MAKRIPSLTALKAFEAVARLLSFSRAAEELCVSHAAVSHQIKLLETELNLQLFHRTSRSVSLTVEGESYYPSIRDSLNVIAQSTNALTNRKLNEQLVIQSYSSFVNTWLLPRVTQFQSEHPAIHIRIKTSFEDADYNQQQFDIGVFKGPQIDGRLYYQKLFNTRIFPICSPTLMSKAHNNLADIKEYSLLQVPSSKNEAEDWGLWLAAAGINQEELSFGPVFDNYPLVLEAVRNGQGIAMARAPFAAADMANGILIQPFELSVPEPGGWFQVTKEEVKPNSTIDLFSQWLKLEIASDPNFIHAQ